VFPNSIPDGPTEVAESSDEGEKADGTMEGLGGTPFVGVSFAGGAPDDQALLSEPTGSRGGGATDLAEEGSSERRARLHMECDDTPGSGIR